MVYRVLADLVVLIHFAFILFVVTGWMLVARWWRLVVLHLPSVVWAVLIELRGWHCPLTHVENWLRGRGDSSGYGGGFVERYIVPIVYPEILTREQQMVLGVAVLVVNGAAYLFLTSRWMRKQRTV